jgi:glycosyltransferase involved in cell wall biosynthesis
MKFSVVIPAHNEEELIGKCLAGIAAAREESGEPVEVIVALNRCTDRTESIARESGALVVCEDAKNLSLIRNAGAAAASGDVIVTIDADSVMSRNTFCEIRRLLESGRYIGGGTRIIPERFSPGIILSGLFIALFVAWRRIPSAGLFWCRREDFEAIGGFNSKMLTVEDLDFAQRLKAHGAKQGKRYGTLWRAHIITSCRKFDRLGDWFVLREPGTLLRLLRGTHQEEADRFYYDYKR